MNPRSLIATGVACFAAAGAGGAITADALASPWYQGLAKPSWQPPGWLFGPVWTLLYGMIAVSGAIVFSRQGGEAAEARRTWIAQLGLNLLWSAVFFGLRTPFGGLLVIVALWCAIVSYIAKVRSLSKAAAGLFVPYALWVSFATALNAWIWWHNRQPNG